MLFSASGAVVPDPVIVKNSSAHGLSAIGDLENQKRYVVELLDESDAEEEARMIRLWICYSVIAAVAGAVVVGVILVPIVVTNRT
jgi:hypothetical protein